MSVSPNTKRKSLFVGSKCLLWLFLSLILSSLVGCIGTEISSLPAIPRGIHTLGVTINKTQQGYPTSYSLDTTKLTLEVMQQLNQAGFKVIPPERAQSTPTAAILQIDLNLTSAYIGVSYAISVKLIKKLKLANSQDKLTSVATWSAGQSGFLRASDIFYLYDYTTAAVNQFIKSAQSNH
ncbi:hypothetical conserved protein [Candidatus Nitrosoglobus terrae]|uniref:Hypothetical conserved protein n=1 Tax=Candidatus Nitrosoglobus terrae TaxID=1630141 RepID=A0A1Q2SM53_9GAMM|nr:hypothetical protein [Candidatus Nitrosoglobus terrae]BAW80187.1 hypothetical conserved protein [Candidatus Nitrosoglobus terrae]